MDYNEIIEMEQRIRSAGERARQALRELLELILSAQYRAERYYGKDD